MKLRLFIGLPLTNCLINKISFLEKEIDKKSGIKFNWLPLENLHLTLLFIGYVNYESYLRLVDIFSTIKLTKPFFLEITKIDYGPPGSKRMIWLYGKRNKYLEEFKEIVEEKISKAGISYQRENRTYLPHINLIRLKMISNFPILGEKLNWKVTLSEVTIFQSYLLKTGSKYEKLKSINV